MLKDTVLTSVKESVLEHPEGEALFAILASERLMIDYRGDDLPRWIDNFTELAMALQDNPTITASIGYWCLRFTSPKAEDLFEFEEFTDYIWGNDGFEHQKNKDGTFSICWSAG